MRGIMPGHHIPTLVLVGGFLGAGKTTLILGAAALLAKRGLRVGVIMNDQASGLVDARFAAAEQVSTREVAGGCFCCRFADLLDAANHLLAGRPDVIFAEPVGSCIDLSATILQPLKAFHRGAYKAAPLTVLLDPDLAERVYANRVDADVSYLFRKQVDEADMVCVTKVDKYSGPLRLPVTVDFRVSALTGDGVEEWLAEVLNSSRASGARLLEVDYARYAEAEAALGWLNLRANVRLREPLTPPALTEPLLKELDRSLAAAGIPIAHLKIFDRTAAGHIKASICAHGDEPIPHGTPPAAPARRHELVINLRALGAPEELQRIVRQALEGIGGSVRVEQAGAFRPAPPRPEHRFARTVS
jgi:CobW/HypB/UreG family nucleotide-binding protein